MSDNTIAFENLADREVDDIARELSSLMDDVETDDYRGTSVDGDPRMFRIEVLANYLHWFYPDKLDKRFNVQEG